MTRFAALKPTQALIDWIKGRLPPEAGYAEWAVKDTLCTVLFDENEEPIVATAIDGLTDHCCDLTIVSDGTSRWATAKFICGTYEFVFELLKVNRISMLVAACNEPALAMNRALGHVQEGLHRDYFGPGRDAISFSYLRKNWEASRWYARSKRSLSVNRTD